MQYLRKVVCPSLKINVVIECQAKALILYTKCRNLGYSDAEIDDLNLLDDEPIKKSDNDFEQLMKKVKKKK